MKFSELKKSGFSWCLQGWRTHDRRSVTALEEFVAGFGFAIDEWSADDFLVHTDGSDGLGSGSRFLDIAQIIAKGHEHVKALAPKPWDRSAKATFRHKENAALERLFSTYKASYMAEALERKTKEAIVSARIATRQYNIALQELVGCHRARAEGVGALPKTDIEDLNKLMSEGFYELREIGDVRISFITRNVFLSELKPRAGLDLLVNLGSFCVEVTLSNLAFMIYPWRHNIQVDEYYHPHIAGDHYLCLGTATRAYGNLCKEGDLVGVLRLIQSALHQYNPGSTYIDLARLSAAVKIRDDERASTAPPEMRQEPPPVPPDPEPTYTITAEPLLGALLSAERARIATQAALPPLDAARVRTFMDALTPTTARGRAAGEFTVNWTEPTAPEDQEEYDF